MNGLRAAALALAFCIPLAAAAQGTTTTDPKKAPKAEATKDQKTAPPATKPTDAPPKKATTTHKKAPPKKAPAKKIDGKAQATGQGGTIQKYEAGKAPTLKDAKGNTIQTSPDAYDISSATTPPPKKK